MISTELPLAVIAELREAKKDLQHHGIADRLTELIGAPITGVLKLLPAATSDVLNAAIDKSLHLPLDAALKTLGNNSRQAKKP